MKRVSRTIVAAVAAALIAATPAAMAREAGSFVSPVSGEDMLFDLFFVRPLALLGTVLGSATFIVTLPFSIAGQNGEEAMNQLVVAPGAYTFSRPMGHFGTCRDASGVC